MEQENAAVANAKSPSCMQDGLGGSIGREQVDLLNDQLFRLEQRESITLVSRHQQLQVIELKVKAGFGGDLRHVVVKIRHVIDVAVTILQRSS